MKVYKVLKIDGTEYGKTNDNSMYTLESALYAMVFLEEIKQSIEEDLAAGELLEYTFITVSIKANSNKFIIKNLFVENNSSYDIEIAQDAFWRAAKKYRDIKSQEWNELAITYDGNDVHFEVE